MTLPPIVQMAVTGLAHHKLRSLLTMLGMVFGVGAVIAMLAISEGARAQAIGAIRQMGVDKILIKSVKPPPAQNKDEKEKRSRTLRYGVTFDDCDHLMAACPGLDGQVAAREARKPVHAGSRSFDARIIATTRGYRDVGRLEIARGRFLSDLDLDRRQSVAVLGSDIARRLFPLADPLGKDVRIGDQWMRVVGITAPKKAAGIGGIAADELNRTIYLPESAARVCFGVRNVQVESGGYEISNVEVTQLVQRYGDGTDVIAAGNLVRAVLARSHPKRDVEVVVPLELLEQQRQTQRIFATVMGSIASISLLVGGIGIMNIMLANVLERTREIGIRRAVGARRVDILVQFLAETVAMSAVGGLAGLGVGLIGALLVAQLAEWPILITSWSIALSIGISILVGIVFGLSPAITAARMQPVEALRGA
jgi:putative ABC transport system permease protein